ncbi:high-affinity Zn(2+) transporter zrt1 [Mortierella sp. 14UC]|nr:high-affinity Zn(2+) transporter zrt1 [Mortierella sp. 14UC]
MRLSLPCRISALGALLILATLAPSSLAQDSALANNNIIIDNTPTEHYSLAKRAGEEEHDHDHEHPPTTATVVAPGATSSAAVTVPTPTTVPSPEHDHDHDHEHDHDHDHEHAEEGHEGHDHDHSESEAEAGHSHGPARTCEAHDHDHGEYVVWHHIVALFVLMFVAALGCVLPMMIRDNNRTRFAVQLGKYFGAGVVLSVAFVHILPEALFALTHPCLSKAWTDDYPGYAPLIMMFSGLTMLVIEYLASTVAVNVEAQNKKAAAAALSGSAVEEAHEHGHAHSHAKGHHHDHGHSHDDSDSAEFQDQKTSAPYVHPLDATELNLSKPANLSSFEDTGCSHAHGLTLLQCGPGVSTKVSTYMLELGIALHSIFIGIALGVLAGSEFLAMTIAICFHQFFEGVALGSRIADLTFKKKWLPVVLVAIFALVTPFGVAIGMGMRSGYRANSVENLIITGVCNSIACGVLLYTAFVTLLGGDILYSERFRAESRHHKASYLVAVWLGAISMAIIALWA